MKYMLRIRGCPSRLKKIGFSMDATLVFKITMTALFIAVIFFFGGFLLMEFLEDRKLVTALFLIGALSLIASVVFLFILIWM